MEGNQPKNRTPLLQRASFRQAIPLLLFLFLSAIAFVLIGYLATSMIRPAVLEIELQRLPDTAQQDHAIAVARLAEHDVAWRLGIGLALLYAILGVLAWGAHRTIRHQNEVINEYTLRMDERVREHSHDVEERAAHEVANAKELVRAKDEFIFVASHELRTAVTILRWSLNKLEGEKEFLEKMTIDIKPVFTMMSSSINRLHALINDLLNVARIESGTLKLEPRFMNISEVLEPALNDLKALAAKNDIAVECDPSEWKKLPPILGDPVRLREVFANLFSNAVKYNKPRGKVGCAADVHDPYLHVYVYDTGLGIKKENISKLFVKFFREHEQGEGTGLGLWITKEIVSRLGGDIGVESEEGKGTIFTVKLPLAKK